MFLELLVVKQKIQSATVPNKDQRTVYQVETELINKDRIIKVRQLNYAVSDGLYASLSQTLKMYLQDKEPVMLTLDCGSNTEDIIVLRDFESFAKVK